MLYLNRINKTYKFFYRFYNPSKIKGFINFKIDNFGNYIELRFNLKFMSNLYN